MNAQPGDVVLVLVPGGQFLIGLMAGDGGSLEYPAQLTFITIPQPGPIAGTMNFMTQAIVAPIPVPVFPMPMGAVGVVMNADELGQSFAGGQQFLKNYHAYVTAQRSPPAPVRRILH